MAIEAVGTKRTRKSMEALKGALIASQLSLVLNAGTRSRVAGVQFSPDGKYVVVATWDGAARVWDATTGKKISDLTGHGEHVNSATFSPDGKYIVTTSQDTFARIWEGWEIGSPKIFRTLSESSEIFTAEFSPDQEYILTAGGEGKVHVWAWKSSAPEEVARLDIALALAGPVAAPQVTPVTVVDVPSVQPTPEPSPRASPVAAGMTAASSSAPGKILIFKAAFSPDGNYIIVGAKTKRAVVWQWKEEKNNQVKIKLIGHNSSVYDVAFSHDGAYAVTGSDDATAMVWDLKKPEVALVKFDLGTNRIRGVAFSPDDKLVATASYDRLARLWEWKLFEPAVRVAQKSEERPQPMILSGQTGLYVFCVSFSPKTPFVATGSDDGTARVWRTERLDRSMLDKLSPEELLKLAKSRVTRQLTDQEKDL